MVQTIRESAVAKARGFSLIELMIAVAIVGILVAIAVPSYQNHLRKGRRAEAQAFISQVALKEQQYLLDARQYAVGGSAIADLSLAVPDSVSLHYGVTVTADPATPVPAPSFLVTATPIAGGVQEPDGELSITQAGVKKRMVAGVDKGW
jgi:type IV pilus assembly protein PilE